MTEQIETPPARKTRVYRHCQNRYCGMRLKTRQHVLCASCQAAGAWGAVLAFVISGLLKALGVL
jgi:hypothetical protein